MRGCILVLLCLVFAPRAAAAQLKLEFKDLVKRADIAFHGRVAALAEEVVPEKGMAFTHVTFELQRVLINRTGTALGETVELTFAGGRVGGEIVRVSGVPAFAPSEEVVVFALHDGTRYASPVVGRNQGLFRVLRDEASGVRYPLSAGGRGIARIEKGSIVVADRVASVKGGEILWKEAPTLPGLTRAEAPIAAAGSGALQARSSGASKPLRPQTLVSLTELFDAVDEHYRKLPGGRR